jgi:hypothetical protein
MRSALSILGLVIAFAIAMFVMKRQAGQLVHRAPASAASAASPAGATAPATVTTPDAVRQQVQQSMEQGSARASDAQP